ncbi:lysylphosphatidylglycerol synthase transmembrane domain-containing protein [Microbacterium deminutum]
MTAAVGARPARAAPSAARLRAWGRGAVGAVILVAIILQAGAAPFVRGLAAVSVPSVVAALLLTAAATAAAAWRWRILAGRLGLALTWPQAVSAYYRSQFLNTVLPGGVVGDVHRAVSHGRSVSQVAQASRAVVAERTAGQVVQIGLAVMVLVALGMSAYAPAVGIVLLAVVVACAGVVVAAAVSTRARDVVHRELDAVRTAFGTVGTVAKVVVASLVVVAGHVATFVVACLAVGVDAPPQRLAAVALIAVLAASIPFNIGGWGPREGAAAWAFTSAGLGAATGLAASTAFGVLAMIAVAPGAAVAAASAFHRRRATRAAAVEESS